MARADATSASIDTPTSLPVPVVEPDVRSTISTPTLRPLARAGIRRAKFAATSRVSSWGAIGTIISRLGSKYCFANERAWAWATSADLKLLRLTSPGAEVCGLRKCPPLPTTSEASADMRLANSWANSSICAALWVRWMRKRLTLSMV